MAVLRQNGYRRDKETDGAAEATRSVIAAMALPPIGHAVICLAGSAALPRPTQVNGVTVISLSHLVEWITAQPPLVSPIAAAEMADRLSLLLRPATRPQSPPYQRTSRRRAATIRSCPLNHPATGPRSGRPPRDPLRSDECSRLSPASRWSSLRRDLRARHEPSAAAQVAAGAARRRARWVSTSSRSRGRLEAAVAALARSAAAHDVVSVSRRSHTSGECAALTRASRGTLTMRTPPRSSMPRAIPRRRAAG